MAEMNLAVFGIYPKRASCEYALSALKVAGFRDTDISVVLQENRETEHLVAKPTKKMPEDPSSRPVFAGALGWLGVTGGAVVPGLDEFVIAGPIAPRLTGISASRMPGGLAEALSGLGIPHHAARVYQLRVENGGVLISVNCDTTKSVSQAMQSFVSTGAEDIATAGELIAD